MLGLCAFGEPAFGCCAVRSRQREKVSLYAAGLFHCRVCRCRLNMIAMLKALGLYDHFQVPLTKISQLPTNNSLRQRLV